MFFYVSKILLALTWPSNLITLCLVVGVVLLVLGRSLRWARRWLVAGVFGLVVCGFSPLGHWMVLPLENRFVRDTLPERVAGIIILGGFESPGIGQARGELSLNEAAERLTEALLVAKSHPQALVVFTGGDGSLIAPRPSAASEVGGYLKAMGIEPSRIVLEGRSRTTYENAIYVKDLVQPRPGQSWVLVTSAFHMPRAMGTFRQAGFHVLPWPSDYRTRGAVDLWTTFSNPPGGLERVDFAFKEWIGLLAYRLTGRSEALWPGSELAGGRRIVAPPVKIQSMPQ